MPLISFAPAHVHLDCLNSYAVELSEVGRSLEAENVSTFVTRSPLARYYPEWQGTLSELRSKRRRRSTVAFSRTQIEQEYDVELEALGNVINKARVRTAVDFMKANLHRPIKLTELAGAVNLSPRYFSQLFKSETGIAPGEYLIRLRIEKPPSF
jgi:YesN/AraC family two-component response regulator